ncbi:MAG: endonuclease domain-containing protein [Devosia sp.]|nr:endonuclease domain-containing protein [Devosia sp.]
MRHVPTMAEDRLWRLLRSRRFAAFKFRRQVPLGPYIADFACFAPRLIVEVDGSQHAEDPGDARRDDWLRRDGFRILRIWNSDLLARTPQVMEAIWQALNEEVKR